MTRQLGSNAPKSSLDGQRESVIEDAEIDNPKILNIFGLRKRERLCGVGLLKRLGAKGTDDSFFSTSHVASLPLLSTLTNDNGTKQAVNDYVGNIADLLFEIDKGELYKYIGRVPESLKHDVFQEFDGHLLFDNRFDDLPFAKGDADVAKELLKKFMNDAFGSKIIKPLPYYALLLADGDRMGTVIDNQSTIQSHKDVSNALSSFAASCKPIVESNNGCLVYAGGDDVLAFVPLHTVLDCAKELADDFAGKLKDFTDKNGDKPTLSVGIAVAHHIEPLQDALATMRHAEKAAKAVDRKNALAIILSKRSGVDTTIKGSWVNDRNTGESFDERLKWFIQLHLDDALPDGVAYELRDLSLRFSSVPSLKTAMTADAIRILQRKRSNKGLNKVSKDILGKLKDLIENSDLLLEDLANEIIVGIDFAKAYKQASKQAKGEAEL